jgi:hypothetical protein
MTVANRLTCLSTNKLNIMTISGTDTTLMSYILLMNCEFTLCLFVCLWVCLLVCLYLGRQMGGCYQSCPSYSIVSNLLLT